MNYLPKLKYNQIQPSYIVDSKNKEELENLYKEVKEHLGGDCWAAIVDNDILFNSYNTSVEMVNKIQDDVVRDHIIKNTHASLFAIIFREDRPRTIVIYMFGKNSWALHIRYYNVSGKFLVNKYT